MNYYKTLEFTNIREMLAGYAQSPHAKNKALKLEPFLSENQCIARLDETTQAKKLLESLGNPPMDSMEELEEVLAIVKAGGMLIPEQFHILDRFLATCKRMVSYLKRGESIYVAISSYHNYITPLDDLREEISMTIRNNTVDDSASSTLRNIRRKLEIAKSSVQNQLERLLRGNPDWFSDSFLIQRSGRYALPVKKQFRGKINGTVIDSSSSGATYFIEPSSIQKTQNEILSLEVMEENEVIKILYTLTATVESHILELEQNRKSIEELDFLFAKAKLSASMDATEVRLTTDRKINLVNARHPLLDKDICVPLNLSFGGDQRGVIITGPNTGGKTVTLKTIGLLSLMAQSGLHIPADPSSSICMNNLVLCDIGDGQSISQNLSTFSAHMTRVIEILQYTTAESLVLFDELGSGTDPAEGMGIAVAVLQELLSRKCLFITTTHYPEIKDFAVKTPNVINARMAFDRENLTPLYRLELGESGESCAFYIAQKLGLPSDMLANAHKATYGVAADYGNQKLETIKTPKIKAVPTQKPVADIPIYHLGDSVMLSPEQKVGIVYLPTQDDGTVGVQIAKTKQKVSYKRLHLLASAKDLYPDDYDFSIIFDSVDIRKSRHTMGRKHDPNMVIEYHEDDDWKKNSSL